VGFIISKPITDDFTDFFNSFHLNITLAERNYLLGSFFLDTFSFTNNPAVYLSYRSNKNSNS